FECLCVLGVIPEIALPSQTHEKVLPIGCRHQRLSGVVSCKSIAPQGPPLRLQHHLLTSLPIGYAPLTVPGHLDLGAVIRLNSVALQRHQTRVRRQHTSALITADGALLDHHGSLAGLDKDAIESVAAHKGFCDVDIC